jgi:hypothetical protein
VVIKKNFFSRKGCRKTYSVDEDFNKTQGPDRLDIVGRGVHLRHEAELAHGERVGEDDVGG